MNRIISVLIITVCLSVSFMSCKKDKLLTDPSATVSFSQDSVLFDTVFTNIGSTTRNIRVINNNNQKINISSILLENGQASSFFLNVDGTPGKMVEDVEILANDSIYIFIQVNINPNSTLSPFIIQDKIIFDVNGNQQSVKLEAWGQDAYYHFPNQAIQYQNGYLPYSTIAYSVSPSGPASITNTTVTWNNDKPHVVYGWLVVDSTQKLVINAGVKVYFHQNAGLWVYRYGTLQVNGTAGNEVVFQGDRREADYADEPGQWDRIWINEGHTDNYINYAIIKNNFIGIQASILSNASQPTRLKITNTIIKNCSKWGLYTQYFDIWSGNNVIANCKEYCAALTWGGKYTFLHTTFANYFNKTVTWNNDKPHVVYGWLVVDSTQKLVINAGVKVYFHQNAGLWVYRYGTLQVNGTAGNEVVFQGDRREADYADEPGQWDRIWINEGHTDNYINYAIIKNNFIGIQASILSDASQPTRLKITNTIIKNCSKWGLYTQYFNIWSGNNVIANCKEYCAALTWGGKYTFLHTTFANYFNKTGGRGGQPCVHIDNYDGSQIIPMDSVYFANSIIDGSQGSELEMDVRPIGTQVCKITNCLIKGSITTNTLITNTGNVFNGNADFNNSANYDFKINGGSAAKTLGDQTVIAPYLSILGTDLSGSGSRLSPPISAGAYQYQP